MEAKEIAIRFMRPYVERGSDERFLRDMGSFSNGIGVVIGGYANGKKVSNNQIAVTMNDNAFIFNKVDLIDEIKNPSKQVALL